MIYTHCENILAPEDNGKKNEMSLIKTNIRNILLAVMDVS